MTDFPGIEKRPFGTTKNGEPVDAYVLTNRKGATATILSYAGAIADLQVPDKHGNLGRVTLGFPEGVENFEKSPHFGALVGRVANRIKEGHFELDGKEYQLAINNGPNALHGGPTGYSKRVWTVEPRHSTEGPSLKLTIDDPDGHEGYPGHVGVEVHYTWTDFNVFRIEYRATTDAATPINLTNHAYWNLKDGGESDVLSHLLRVDADTYTPVDDTLIPTGEIKPVEGTPFDFRAPKPIGADIEAAGGYDHNFVLRYDDGRLVKAAELDEPTTGRHMEVWTTQPGMQVYSGNFLDGTLTGWNGKPYGKQHALCLETQHFPDSINHPEFPNTVLRPGETFTSTTEYRFTVVNTHNPL
jgi:aldose 1-epimerase